MSLRSSLLRQCRALQAYRQPLAAQRILQRPIQRRTFFAYPSIRQEKTPDPSPESSASTEQSSSPETPAEKAPERKTEAAAKDVPPPPPKRETDPKDQEIAELKDKLLRSIAEFRNLQAQTKREVSAAQAYTIQRFSSDLLDTIDTLTAALESCPPAPPLETNDPNQKEDVLVTEHRNLHEGLKMIEHILLRTLERHGLTVIPSEGEPNPVFHEVVKEIEGEDKDKGIIGQVIKRGYMLNGKVLRQAKVALIKPKAPEAKTE